MTAQVGFLQGSKQWIQNTASRVGTAITQTRVWVWVRDKKNSAVQKVANVWNNTRTKVSNFWNEKIVNSDFIQKSIKPVWDDLDKKQMGMTLLKYGAATITPVALAALLFELPTVGLVAGVSSIVAVFGIKSIVDQFYAKRNGDVNKSLVAIVGIVNNQIQNSTHVALIYPEIEKLRDKRFKHVEDDVKTLSDGVSRLFDRLVQSNTQTQHIEGAKKAFLEKIKDFQVKIDCYTPPQPGQ